PTPPDARTGWWPGRGGGRPRWSGPRSRATARAAPRLATAAPAVVAPRDPPSDRSSRIPRTRRVPNCAGPGHDGHDRDRARRRDGAADGGSVHMTDRQFEVRDHDGVAVVSLGDDENRFNGPFAAGLRATIARLAERGGPVVLTAEGRFFSNGLDLDWLRSQEPDAVEAAFADIYGLLADLLEHPGVVVAAINGHAFGAGVMISAAADHRIQRDDKGFFCLPEV